MNTPASSWKDRFVIDDGRHLPDLVINEDASSAVALYRATCSCGRIPNQPAGTREQALAAHMAHVQSKLGPSKGPAWLPEGARIVILASTMLIAWGTCYASGQFIVDDQDLTGVTAKLVRGGFVLLIISE